MPEKSTSSVQIFYPRFNREKVIQAISKNLDNLRREVPLLLVVLFGSYARGNYTVASDIDLLVVYEGEENKAVYAAVKRAFGIPNIEPHVYSKMEYEGMKSTIEAMTKEGITLFEAKKRI